jgi:hypothetical protein
MQLPTIFKPKHERILDLKNRILKNREAVLDAFSSNIDGAKCCPLLAGQKCINKMCEFFNQFYEVDKSGEKKEYWRCAVTQLPVLLIELNQSIRRLNKES